MTEPSKLRVGDDLSYYLGPDAKRATAEQCAELERALAEAHAQIPATTGEQPK